MLTMLASAALAQHLELSDEAAWQGGDGGLRREGVVVEDVALAEGLNTLGDLVAEGWLEPATVLQNLEKPLS